MLTLTLVLGLLGMLALPSGANGSAAVPPPAVQFDVNFQVSGASHGFAAELQGVANRTGELQASLSTSDPEPHTLDVIRVNKTLYVSADGSPYQAVSDLSSIAGSGAAGLLPGGVPPGCQTAAGGIATTLQTPAGRSALSDLANVQDLGAATIDGVTAEHYSASVDLGTVLADPLVQQGLGEITSDCGGSPSSGLDPSLLAGFLSGSTATMDAYVDASNGLPRQFMVALNLQPLSLQFSANGTTSPVATPAVISAP